MIKYEKADLMFGGTEDPAAFVDVRALGMSVEGTNYKVFFFLVFFSFLFILLMIFPQKGILQSVDRAS